MHVQHHTGNFRAQCSDQSISQNAHGGSSSGLSDPSSHARAVVSWSHPKKGLSSPILSPLFNRDPYALHGLLAHTEHAVSLKEVHTPGMLKNMPARLWAVTAAMSKLQHQEHARTFETRVASSGEARGPAAGHGSTQSPGSRHIRNALFDLT